MSFFKKSTGADAAQEATGEKDMGNRVLIPEDTTVLAVVDSAKIESPNEYHNGRIQIEWKVLKPALYLGVSIKHNLQVWNEQDSKRDKALDMLAAVDKNAGGKLAAAGTEPTEDSLNRALVGKAMLLTMGVYDGRNWVSKVAPSKAKPAPEPKPIPDPSIVDDDDIPF